MNYYKPESFSTFTNFELIEGVKRIESDSSCVAFYFESGGFVTLVKKTQVSGLSLQNIRWAELSPRLFDYYLRDGIFHIFCPFAKGGAFADIPYFKKED